MSALVIHDVANDEIEWSIGETLITETTDRATLQAAKGRLRLNASNGFTPVDGIVLDECRVDALLKAMDTAVQR